MNLKNDGKEENLSNLLKNVLFSSNKNKKDSNKKMSLLWISLFCEDDTVRKNH